ncbi:hypothetical protein Sfr7A_30940 [Streptomyces xinghaiensis]|uniref:Twin-arginine translocation signal domain-containing protein n=1 Tax=Streptomyces xinghaiensis TaxID=1038928 RepID=A0A3M8F6Q5_9ACTN|nr:hypothetical protein Sfr7A_30940 [Streptomyces xinghaiensis]RKM91040.1 twin-arginine translocation signal domain-containing protein [Streptomyces xinghaiensis]RNC72364.1 twin-arginine translocation signal domain-containing protein [Streptomyces xinghaiensis]
MLMLWGFRWSRFRLGVRPHGVFRRPPVCRGPLRVTCVTRRTRQLSRGWAEWWGARPSAAVDGGGRRAAPVPALPLLRPDSVRPYTGGPLDTTASARTGSVTGDAPDPDVSDVPAVPAVLGVSGVTRAVGAPGGPPPAADEPVPLSRRRFLRAAGTATAGAAVSGVTPALPPLRPPPHPRLYPHPPGASRSLSPPPPTAPGLSPPAAGGWSPRYRTSCGRYPSVTVTVTVTVAVAVAATVRGITAVTEVLPAVAPPGIQRAPPPLSPRPASSPPAPCSRRTANCSPSARTGAAASICGCCGPTAPACVSSPTGRGTTAARPGRRTAPGSPSPPSAAATRWPAARTGSGPSAWPTAG